MTQKIENLLSDLYYDPEGPGSFGGVEDLYRVAKKKYKTINRSQIQRWLQQQDAYTLHKRITKKFKRNKVFTDGIDDLWQADLCDMSKLVRYNNAHRYILTIIDVFSKYCWAYPVKTKSAGDVTKAFEKAVKTGRSPKKLQTDQGK